MYRKALSFIIAAVLVLVVCAACSETVGERVIDTSNTIRGSGKAATETRALGSFSGVKLLTSGNLTIQKGAERSLKIEADDNLLPMLTSAIKNDQLELGTSQSVAARIQIKYTLTTPELNQVGLFGSGNIEATDFDFANLSVLVSGSGNITLAGRAASQEITIAGSGNYRAEKLVSRQATVHVNGSGETYLNVSDTLNANIGGSGSVYYSGNPVVTKQILGSGKVVSR